MLIQYQKFSFRNSTVTLIEQADEIITEYMAEGYELTLRQLYYQFVARGIIANKDSEYKRLGSVVNDARLAGMLDWSAIVDRTRKIQINSHWENPSEIIQETVDVYALDTRKTQSVYIEVWVEKEALAGVLERACEPLDVPYFSCKGYVSQSAMWRAGRRILSELKTTHHKQALILHLGDHDPSGIDMTRDIQERLILFGADVEVKRIALNMNQIEQFSPPANPAKVTDSRCNGYIAEYGEESWELDALDPRTINKLVTDEINYLTNQPERKILIQKQEQQREKLQMVANNFDGLDI